MESTKRKALRQSRRQISLGWESSGLTQLSYCQKHGISYSVFKYWRRKFRENIEGRTKQPAQSGVLPPRFIELQRPDDSDVQVIHITYPNGVSIIVPASMDVERIGILAGSWKNQ